MITRAWNSLTQRVAASFGARAGPYNPYRFKDYLAPRNYPTNKEIVEGVARAERGLIHPVRNMRHVNPVRQSGPIPAYSGTYTMEDIKRIYVGTTFGYDFHYCQMDIDELMRRVPGITRRECEHIVKLGLTPYEQLDYAYLAYNLGLDVEYHPNQVYIARQVVTNSKGQKVEIMWNGFAFEDLSMLQVGFAPILENVDYHWEIFLWADPPIKPTGDLDLGVPNTWFEYEMELSNELNIAEDQMPIPEDIRPYGTPRNPFARSYLWKSQEKIDEEKTMADPNYVIPA